MKLLYTFINAMTLIFIFSSTAFAQVTYVNGASTGAGDGTSWADSYTELTAALDATAGGEIWIAAGTYTPMNFELDTLNTFDVRNEISFFGGFAGTETSKGERILGENTTILSGDILGNDIDNNFTTNKEDNVFHIMTFFAPDFSIIDLDGITFQGGQTRESGDGNDYSWRGGAIYSFNTLNISYCNFNNNYARSGGSVYLASMGTGGSNGSSIDNCVFEKNYSVSQGAGVYALFVHDVSVSNTMFQNNITNRGALYPSLCNSFLIENCTFQNNISTSSSNFGGAMYIWNSTCIISDCNFDSNNTGNGAAVYIDGREMEVSIADNIIFDNCTFTGNSALDFGGGAIRSFTASYRINDCDFLNNISSNGGAIFSSGPGQEIIISNNTFEGNTADFGASQACYGLYSNYFLINNTYTENVANTSGGGLINGFGANVNIDECEFTANIARFGGAIFNQNDTTNVEIYNSNFVKNSVNEGNGGAINIISPVTLTIDKCLFQSNIAGFGGAINGNQGSEVDVIEGFVHISNSSFILNNVTGQGAGISLVDLDLEMTNTVIATNFNTGEGAGGGLSLNTTANRTSTFNITNSSIVDNFALIGGGIGSFSEDMTSNNVINLQNTILSNEGSNYQVEAGGPIVNSLGGNISTDATLESILTATGDINNSGDIMFVDRGIYDFRLLEDSPAINIGIATGAPDTDILGNPRVGAPDAGAYENQDPLGIEVIENAGQLTMMPNPVQSNTSISLSNNWNGNISLSILDASGKLIKSYSSQKTNQTLILDVDFTLLNTGNYFLTVQSSKRKTSIPFVKI